MALVKIPSEQRTISDTSDLCAFFAERGIEYERTDYVAVEPGAPTDVVLAAYKTKIDELKARGGASGVDKGFQPVCFGPAYFPASLSGTGR
jgi:cupin superfamily acireductone dioxygenase involved in methionine salvage